MAELEKFKALYGKIDFPADILSIPFEVLEYRNKLGITTSEFEFICWIFHLTNKDYNEIRDKDINRRCTRQRKSLQAKGYLKIKIARTYQDKHCIKVGLVYDFTELKNKIEELKEEDKKLQELEAPVTVIYEEPGLFNEDIDNSPLYPNKLLNDDEEIKELKLQNEFLEKYNIVHKEILNYKIDYTAKAPYKKYLLDIFRKRKNDNIDEVLETAKQNFLKLNYHQRDSLAFQDLLKYIWTEETSINKPNNQNTRKRPFGNKINNDDKLEIKSANKYSIPKGLDTLEYLLSIIEKGGNPDEAYNEITRTVV